MKILKLGREWTHQGIKWPAGSTLVLTDVTAGRLLMEASPAETVRLTKDGPVLVTAPLTGSPHWRKYCAGPAPVKALFVRPGGFGDLLNLLSVIQIFKRHHPDVEVDVCCYSHFWEVLHNATMKGSVWSYPMRLEDFQKYDVVFWMEDVVEYRPEGKTTPLFDIMMAFTGLVAPWEPAYKVADNERFEAIGAYGYPVEQTAAHKPRVGIQVASSSMARDWPQTNLMKFIMQVETKGWELVLFGTAGQLQPWVLGASRHVRNLVGRTDLSFRQTAAIAEVCDVLVTPDSSFLHLGAHLGVPTVALFGSFPGELRASYYPKVKVLQAQGTCAPCFHHGAGWPKKGPCNLTNQCEVLACISAEEVISAVETMLIK